MWLMGRAREHPWEVGSLLGLTLGVIVLFWGILVSEQRSGEARGRDRGPLPGPFLTAHGQHLGKQGKKKGFLPEATHNICVGCVGY